MRGPEEYEFLKESFEPVWEEFNELIGNPSLLVNGSEVHLNIVFGSDYKVGQQCYFKPTIDFFYSVPCTCDGAEQSQCHTCMCVVYSDKGQEVIIIHTCTI